MTTRKRAASDAVRGLERAVVIDSAPATISEGAMRDGEEGAVFDEDAYLGLLADLRGRSQEVTITLFKRPEDGRSAKFSSLGSISQHDYPTFSELEEYLLSEYGGGDYQLRVHGAGHRGVIHNKNFSLIESASSKAKRLMNPGNSGNNGLVNAAIDYSRENQQRVHEAFDKLKELALSRPQGQGADFILKLVAAAAPFAPLIIRMLPKRQDPLEMLRALLMMQDQFKTMQKPTEDESPYIGLMSKVLDNFGGTIAEAARQQMVVQSKGTPGGQGQQEQKRSVEMDEFVLIVRQLLSLCLRGAEAGSEANIYAYLISDQLREDHLEKLAQFVLDDQALTLLAGLDQRVANHYEWFEALLVTLKEELVGRKYLPEGEGSEGEELGGKKDEGLTGAKKETIKRQKTDE